MLHLSKLCVYHFNAFYFLVSVYLGLVFPLHVIGAVTVILSLSYIYVETLCRPIRLCHCLKY